MGVERPGGHDTREISDSTTGAQSREDIYMKHSIPNGTDAVKAFVKAAYGDTLPVGTSDFKLKVQITARVNRGEDFTQPCWQTAKPEMMLKLLVAYNPLMAGVLADVVAEGKVAERLNGLSSERIASVDAFIAACRLCTDAHKLYTGKTTFPVAEVEIID
jgi:hypothetical protein